MYPHIADAYDLYVACRNQNLIHMRVEKDKGKKVEHKVIPVTTGLGTLPEPGGYLDQPNWLIEMFHVFRSADMVATQKMLKK